jgi:rhodanese-related sulfurtransferase
MSIELFLDEDITRGLFMTKLRIVFAATLAVVLVLGASGCAPAKLDVDGVTAIIDTRTAESYASSHIVGAVNIEYATGNYLAMVASMGKLGKYYVYGTTEDEAGLAVQDMYSLGLKDITNLGSFEDAQHVLPLGVTK